MIRSLYDVFAAIRDDESGEFMDMYMRVYSVGLLNILYMNMYIYIYIYKYVLSVYIYKNIYFMYVCVYIYRLLRSFFAVCGGG